MFGIFNLTRAAEDDTKNTPAKVKDKKNNDEPCYGGFSNRWRYEECRRNSHRDAKLRGVNSVNAALCVLVCFFFGLAGVSGGIIIYDFIQQNREFYYPPGSLKNHDEIIVAAPLKTDTRTSLSDDEEAEFVNFSKRAGVLTLEDVTEDLAMRYRIPRGVMVKVTQSYSESQEIFNAGDIIVAVNGVEIYDLESLNAQSENCIDDESFTITIFRNNKYVDLVILNQIS